jgi:hypothetical protein
MTAHVIFALVLYGLGFARPKTRRELARWHANHMQPECFMQKVLVRHGRPQGSMFETRSSVDLGPLNRSCVHEVDGSMGGSVVCLQSPRQFVYQLMHVGGSIYFFWYIKLHIEFIYQKNIYGLCISNLYIKFVHQFFVSSRFPAGWTQPEHSVHHGLTLLGVVCVCAVGINSARPLCIAWTTAGRSTARPIARRTTRLVCGPHMRMDQMVRPSTWQGPRHVSLYLTSDSHISRSVHLESCTF